MKFEEIYSKQITRSLNPAVSATDISSATAHIEIEEYVFTDEIINDLYIILNAIREKRVSHTGVWLNGYYGSGKSHFLKYLNYCLSPEYGERALSRLQEAVEQRDPLQTGSNSNVIPAEMRDLASWLHKAKIDTVLFNMGEVHNIRSDQSLVFTEVFWNRFNAFRGFNSFNISLAQHLEKFLQSKGQFEAFKQRLEDDGFYWSTQASDLATQELDMILDIAKELVPTMSIDAVRPHIAANDYNVSVESFMNELQQYLADKDDNYRLLFLADEVSQFISDNRGVLLQLQEMITRLHEKCADKIWVVCTAQQDLTELMDGCHIQKSSEDYGKIMGRFEVRASLKSTQAEYITQKRILEKNGNGEIALKKLYDSKKDAIISQFQLPSAYHAYSDKQNFVDFYPFVPYQFKLIAKVFASFESLGYVVKEVKDNERSILKITHSTAKYTKDEEVGSFISFDQFFREMFENNLTATGQKAMKNAMDVIGNYPQKDKEFGIRVVRALFMICNLSNTEKMQFPATLDNLVCLLMRDVDQNKLQLCDKIKEVLQYLIDNYVIREEAGHNGAPDTYSLFSEDEREVAQMIKNSSPDFETLANEWRKLFYDYLGSAPANKVTFHNATFTVGINIMGRMLLTSNPNIVIDLVDDSDTEIPEVYSMRNAVNHLGIFIYPLYHKNLQANRDFYWYCQIQKYKTDNRAATPERAHTDEEFSARANDLYNKKIKPAFAKMFDSCCFVLGQQVVKAEELGNVRGMERYKAILNRQLEQVYPDAALVDSDKFPRTTEELRRLILRPIENNEYSSLKVMTEAEKRVEEYLNRQIRDVNLSELLIRYNGAPYGWSDFAIIHVVNELVRRGMRALTYNNEANCSKTVIADKIVRTSEQQKFVVKQAEHIPQETINGAIDAWRYIFNVTTVFPTVEGNELYRLMTDVNSTLEVQRTTYEKLNSPDKHYPFTGILQEALKIMNAWREERDPKKFFEQLIADKENGHTLMDSCKQIEVFITDQEKNYKELRDFIEKNIPNLEYLPDAAQKIFHSLQGIQTDASLIDHFRSYIKLKNELSAMIEERKKEIREEIEKAYNNIFNDLDNIAKQQHVDRYVYAQRDVVIKKKKESDSIAALLLNLNTDAFFKEQSAAIIAAGRRNKKPDSTKNETSTEENNSNNASRVEEEKGPVYIALSTRTTKVIKTEADVDAYLADLKEQLMQHIQNKESVFITK